MAKRRFIQINGELVEVTDGHITSTAHHVVPDIQPYTSMIDGSKITSRSQHREHLKRHGCFEVGNDTRALMKRAATPDVSPQKRHELIRAQVGSMTEAQFRRAIKRDIDFVKWNSREK